jgi:UDP-N-acetylmuramoyl-tripeptide--D-alanyl-D-alanine ligase
LVRRKIGDAVAAMQGRLIAGDSNRFFEGAAIDSRAVRGGELFFALSGEHTDGHRYVAEALARGAAAAVVSHRGVAEETQSAGPRIVVDDVLDALHALTRSVRATFPRHLVAVTGSAGKTTTKDLLVAMLAERFPAAGSPGNLNNLLGFPLALLSLPEPTEWMVAEAGMSMPGELGRLSRLARPEVAIFTNVRWVHLQAFDTPTEGAGLTQIREAKAELLEGLQPGALVVANAADPHTVAIGRRHRDASGRTVWFSRHLELALEPPELQVREVVSRDLGGSEFRVARRGEAASVPVTLQIHGDVAIENFLAAATCALEVGIPLEAIARGASQVTPQPGRGIIRRLRSGARLIDDSYNSNPDALEKAILAAVAVPGDRHWAVLGQMGELGHASQALHRKLGAIAADAGLSSIVGVGEHARYLVEQASAAGARTEWCADADAAAQLVRDRVEPGDVILVKGSRSVGLERVVAALERHDRESVATGGNLEGR